MPVRVLHVYRTYYPDSQGGLEEVIRQICLNNKFLGVESRVLSTGSKPGKTIVHREEALVYRPARSLEIASCSMSLSAFSHFKRLVKWADIVHYHYPWPFADLLHFAARVKKPTVLTYHSDIVRQQFLSKLYAPLMKRFLSSVDRIICTSPNYFATSATLCNFADKVQVIPIGIREDSHPEPAAISTQRMEQQFGRDFFLFVGVLRYYKGLHLLLDAIKNAPYKVVIVGSGPTESELKRQSKALDLDNVVFAGHLLDEDKVNLFKLCRGVVFPSYMRSEAFGVTLLEGSIYGKPLISAEIGSGTSHVNINGETGIVVTPGSPKALREAMDRLHFNPDLARRLGQGARERYERLFTGELMGKRYNRLYLELLSQARDALGKVVFPQRMTIGE